MQVEGLGNRGVARVWQVNNFLVLFFTLHKGEGNRDGEVE